MALEGKKNSCNCFGPEKAYDKINRGRITNKLDACLQRGQSFSPSKTVTMTFRKLKEEPVEETQKPNYTIQEEHPVPENDPGQQMNI